MRFKTLTHTASSRSMCMSLIRPRTMTRSVQLIALFVALSLLGCVQSKGRHGPQPALDGPVVATVLESIACSSTSPLPPARYRPKLATGVVYALALEPGYVRPTQLDSESSQFKPLLTAISKEATEGRPALPSEERSSCGVSIVSSSHWVSRSWDAFPREVPGGLAVIGLSRAVMSDSGRTAYLFSEAGWGPLQGEHDLWKLTLDRKSVV